MDVENKEEETKCDSQRGEASIINDCEHRNTSAADFYPVIWTKLSIVVIYKIA